MKKVLTIAMMFITLFAFRGLAQQPQTLPLDPDVKYGVLPNGLTYYILHNSEPKERANFYIAQKVGSTLETPDQLGLAHFLEHMAFNGTKTYPGKNLLNYLQSKGIRFGQDINAYTSFDETVYNINNVPTNDALLMDSVLLALKDWSGSILLEESEIDAERGVIREEWRQRDNAQTRQYTKMLPAIFEEYQYQQMPIGKMEIVMNFKPEVLRAYYKKWYRPDQQGIIIVGDFDADVMEQKVKELFSTIPMPENATPRTYPTVSDNEKPIYFSFSDPEFQTPQIRLSFKREAVPDSLMNTDMGLIMGDVVPHLICSMINERLADYMQEPNCSYAYAGCRFDKYYVAKNKDSFDVIVIPKQDQEAAYKEALAIVARACKTGFTQGEIERARDKVIANLDKAFNEKNKTSNDARANELIQKFVNNVPAPGIEFERQLKSYYLQALPVAVYNQVASTLMTPTNQVITVAVPSGNEIISEESSVALLNEALVADYTPYVDEVITEPLISELPTPGAVVAESDNAELGTHIFTLSNGAKVVLKTTDFASDNVEVEIFEEGGKRSFEKSQAADVLLMGDAFNMAKIGPFDVKTLSKFLAGKKLDLGFDIGNFTNYFKGHSTVKDFKTLMELIYTSFTALGEDKVAYDAQIAQARALMGNIEKDPNFIFANHCDKAKYGDNPLMMKPDLKTIDQADYSRMIDMIKGITSNAADFTFIFVGNISKEDLKPYLEQYIATLPAGKKSKVKTVTDIKLNPGIRTDVYDQQLQKVSVNVYDCISGDKMKYSVGNAIMTKMVGELLDMIYIETLRESEGGTYGAQTYSTIVPNTSQWQLIYTFGTNPEQQQSLRDRAYSELLNLLNNGANPDHFNKVKEAAIKQLDIKERSNEYWLDNLLMVERGFNSIKGYRAALESLTIDDLNSFMKKLYNGKNRIEVVMNGGPDK